MRNGGGYILLLASPLLGCVEYYHTRLLLAEALHALNRHDGWLMEEENLRSNGEFWPCENPRKVSVCGKLA